MIQPPKTFGERLQAVPKWVLYLVLVLCTSLPLVYAEAVHKGLSVPNEPVPSSQDFYGTLMALPPDSTVLLETDWTNSTRGESGGQFEAFIKIAAARHLKLAIFSTGDPQAPQVAANTIDAVNIDRKAKGLPAFRRWFDWVILGYFANAEGTTNSIGVNLRTAFAGKKEVNPTTGLAVDAISSPVLSGKSFLTNIPLMVVITASNTSVVVIERLSGKVPLAFMVTGVMGPETQVYYTSGQLAGLANGLKGVYDVETLMNTGITSGKWKGTPGITEGMNTGKGTAYYPTLHFALTLLILAVAAGNIGMFLSRRKAS